MIAIDDVSAGDDDAAPTAVAAVACALVAPTADAAEWLRAEIGLPRGLAERVLESCAEFEERLWIIDNSGSMATADGHRLASGRAGAPPKMVGCSRWDELAASLAWHARVAATLRAPTTFVCLNEPGGGAPREVAVGRGAPDAELAAMRAMLSSGPTGRTPLCACLRDAVRRVAARRDALRGAGRKMAVIVASDGCATDGDVEAVMRPLRDLPAWVVVRLCTDDDQVVSYWNQIDEELELDMDVLDDLVGEAKEVCEGNAWLTYGVELHHLREWGTSRKLIDMLDEKSLTVSEIRDFAGLVLGDDLMQELPHPQADLNGFIKGLTRSLATTPVIWDPLRQRKRAWMNVNKIYAAGRREKRRAAWAHATGPGGVAAECSCAIS